MATSFGEIWQTLSQLDISAKVVEKPGTGNPSYLSWGDAWGLLMQHYPEADFSFHTSDRRYEGDEIFEALDGSAEVRCTVHIGDCSRDMWLPVMDHKFNAVFEPDARDISDAKMRCLVKCLALFGLGHSLYAKAKEDVPNESCQPRERGSSRSRSGAGGGRGRAQDNRARPGRQAFDVTKACSDIAAAIDIPMLEDRYDDAVADAKKQQASEAVLDELFAAYDARAGELERGK